MYTISEPVLMFVGACIFFALLIVLAITLYYYVGLGLAIFLIRVALPAILSGGMCMCLFAFLGWAISCSAVIMKIFLFVGGVLGILIELYFWGIREPPRITKRFLY